MLIKNIKIIGSIFIIGLLGLVITSHPFTASAQTATPAQDVKTANQTARTDKLHTECNTAISNRLTALNALSTRVNGLKKLSTDQRTQYTNQITADINGLTSLKTKCDADTDLTTLRADYRSVFTKYRVYAVFIPQLHLLAASDTMGYTADLMSQFAAKLQGRIESVGNPSNLTGLLSDMLAKIADAETQYNLVESQITSLTPDSYNTNPTGTQSTLKNARAEIKTGAGDLKAALADANQIREGLKTAESNSSITPTP